MKMLLFLLSDVLMLFGDDFSAIELLTTDWLMNDPELTALQFAFNFTLLTADSY